MTTTTANTYSISASSNCTTVSSPYVNGSIQYITGSSNTGWSHTYTDGITSLDEKIKDLEASVKMLISVINSNQELKKEYAKLMFVKKLINMDVENV